MLCSLNIIVTHKKESLKGSDIHRTITPNKKTNKQLENINIVGYLENLGKMALFALQLVIKF